MIPPDAYALIIGAMKSGTTTLYGYMERHSAVCPCRTKEPEFFSRRQGHSAEAKRYEDLWEFDPDRHSFALEASTGYTKYPWESGVPERMAEYGIRPRLIYIMRDPFERIESHYNSLRHSRAGRGRIVHEHHVSISDYYLQLSRYRSVFSGAEPLLLDFDELRRDPTAVLDSVLRFLGLEMEEELQVKLHSNPTIPRPLPVRIYDRLVAATGLRAPVPGGVRRALRGRIVRVLGSRRKLSPGEREEVRRRLAPGMRRLRDEFGFDTRRWGF